ncbi:MAG: segregation/condensation protein A [archaeon]|nr:segregation/condensation protein A [archaeon]
MEENEVKKEENLIPVKEHPAHLQVYNIVTGKDPSWHAIIYELVASEQLNPWDIDISVLCKSYLEKIKILEENNFHISSKLLLAAALLLRIKSEVLLNKYIREIDNILFPREDEIKKIIERIEINEDDIPVLSPKTPLPRFKKVTLQELIDALDTAIKTEGRRIHKEIAKKQAERMSHVDIPKFRRINIKERIRKFYARVLTSFKNLNLEEEIKLPYSHFTGTVKEEKIACFLPMLYLSNHGKIWIEQAGHYQEIYLYLYDHFKNAFPDYDKSLVDPEEELEDIPEHLMENYDDNPDKEEGIESIAEMEDAIERPVSETAEEKQEKLEKIKAFEGSVNSDDLPDSPKSKLEKIKAFEGFENPLSDMINEAEEIE